MPDLTNPQIIGALIALAGVGVGIISSWVIALINRFYDNRKHIRDLSVHIALELWRHERALVDRANALRSHMPPSSDPPPERITARSLQEIIRHTIEFTESLTAKRRSK